MLTADFDYHLPQELIAQHPLPQRDTSRLLVLYRDTGRVEHRRFHDLVNFLQTGDVLVLNNSRVIPARLRGVNARTGGVFEILLTEENPPNDSWAMLKPGKRARVGTEIEIRDPNSKIQKLAATVVATNEEGHRRLHFQGGRNILDMLDELGEVPLPPYINREDASELTQDKHRYQTVFAHAAGSVAAPTAGLHFTDELLVAIRERGVDIHFVTLHVGLGTFAPVKAESLAGHTMHHERFALSDTTARAVNEAKARGRRVITVGTTSMRVLETVAQQNQKHLIAGSGRTDIFIHPPFAFQIAAGLVTNFHLPCSTLLMLVSAFAAPGQTRGREMILAAYAEAIKERYRFFSYGDAMLIL